MVLDAAPLPALPETSAPETTGPETTGPPRTKKAVVRPCTAPIRTTGTAAQPAGLLPSWPRMRRCGRESPAAMCTRSWTAGRHDRSSAGSALASSAAERRSPSDRRSSASSSSARASSTDPVPARTGGAPADRGQRVADLPAGGQDRGPVQQRRELRQRPPPRGDRQRLLGELGQHPIGRIGGQCGVDHAENRAPGRAGYRSLPGPAAGSGPVRPAVRRGSGGPRAGGLRSTRTIRPPSGAATAPWPCRESAARRAVAGVPDGDSGTQSARRQGPPGTDGPHQCGAGAPPHHRAATVA